MRRALYAAAVFFVASCAPAFAEVRIEASAGGAVDDYLQLYSSLRKTGERVVINGPCLSACTLALSTIPRDRLCVTQRAILGFHVPVDKHGAEAPKAYTRVMTGAYPAPIRKWIRRHGGLTRRPIFLRGRELTALYPLCPATKEPRVGGREAIFGRSPAPPHQSSSRPAFIAQFTGHSYQVGHTLCIHLGHELVTMNFHCDLAQPNLGRYLLVQQAGRY